MFSSFSRFSSFWVVPGFVISIICGYLPKQDQQRARTIGLMLAMLFRILLLLGISWLVHLVDPLFFIGTLGVSGRDLILFSGGVFLVYKTIKEIYEKLKGQEKEAMIFLQGTSFPL